MQPSRPAEWIAGAESLEKELSMAQIKGMVFLREPMDSDQQLDEWACS